MRRIALLLVFVACSNDITSTNDTPALRLSTSSSTETQVETEVTFFTAQEKRRHKETVAGSVVNGRLRTREKRVTPVLGLLDGVLASSFTMQLDDTMRLVGTSPGTGRPVDNIKLYINGKLSRSVESKWKKVDGGYVLSEQLLTDATSQTRSVVSGTVLYETPAMGRLASGIGSSLQKAMCLLLPQQAYAAGVMCWQEILEFAGATIALAAASATPIGSVFLYLLGWAGWTSALYNMLECIS